MKKLMGEAQEKIAAFMTSESVRPLERALYVYHFGGGTADNVLEALAAFQNGDGGFGHGLENDIRLDDSSVIATTIAFQHLREIDAPADAPLVISGCLYLNDQYDAEALNWEIIPPNVDDAPHAPWWVYGGDLSQSKLNPRAEIAGYLYDYAPHFSDAMREQVTNAVVDTIMNTGIAEMHDLFCALRLYETKSLPEAIKARLFEPLKNAAERLVTRDSAGWAEYGLQPLGVVSSPQSAFAFLFQRELDANLDYLIDQLDDGDYWSPSWTWGAPSEAWAGAERELRGVITLNNLRQLRAFGRLE